MKRRGMETNKIDYIFFCIKSAALGLYRGLSRNCNSRPLRRCLNLSMLRSGLPLFSKSPDMT